MISKAIRRNTREIPTASEFPLFDQILVRRCWAKLHVEFPCLGGGPGAALTADNARPAANCQAHK